MILGWSNAMHWVLTQEGRSVPISVNVYFHIVQASDRALLHPP